METFEREWREWKRTSLKLEFLSGRVSRSTILFYSRYLFPRYGIFVGGIPLA